MRGWRVLSGAVLAMVLALGAERAAAQSHPVTFSMQSILNGFFGETGIVRFDFYDAAFVPEAEAFDAEVVLADEDGTILARHPFRQYYELEDQVFAQVSVVGPAEVQLVEPGLYNIFFLVEGEIVTRMPFVLHEAGDGGDPFTSERSWSFDGFWRQLGYLTEASSAGYQGPEVTFWTGGLDLADPDTPEAVVAVLYDGADVLFHSKRSAGVISPGRFARQSFHLFHPHDANAEANAEVMTMADLTARDGDYVLRVLRRADNAVIRAFHITVENGAVRQHPRAILGYEPQMDFLLPRVTRHGQSLYGLVEAVWLKSR